MVPPTGRNALMANDALNPFTLDPLQLYLLSLTNPGAAAAHRCPLFSGIVA
jgi:hypothetical protein